MTKKDKLKAHVNKITELQAALKKAKEDIAAWENAFKDFLGEAIDAKDQQLTLPEILLKWSELDPE